MSAQKKENVTHQYKGSRTRSVRCPDEFDEAVEDLMNERGQDFGTLCRQALIQCWPQFFSEQLQEMECREAQQESERP